MVLRKSFYIRWSAGRSPRVHEVNPGRDPSGNLQRYGLDEFSMLAKSRSEEGSRKPKDLTLKSHQEWVIL